MAISVEERQRLVRQARALRIRAARHDPNEFCQLVLRNEETGKPIRQAPVHFVWHDLMDVHDRILVWAHVESGKTNQVAIARTLWELGKNRNLRICILSKTKDQARKIAGPIKAYIEQSEELKMIFPDLKPGKPWGEFQFSVDRPTIAKDPSVQVAGVHGNILGSRIDLLVLDDILSYENCKNAAQREDIKAWFKSTMEGRLTGQSRIRCIGTAFHPQDILHDWARMPGWHAVRFPIRDPETGASRWPEQWSQERIEKKIIDLGPVEARRQLFCEARDDSTSKFKQDWIDVCLRNGDGKTMASALKVVPRGYKVFTGVDLAVQKGEANDLTVLFTIAIDPYGNRHVLECRSGKWSGPEIITEIRSAHTRYQSIVMVENNAAQDYILQFVRHGSSIPVKAYTTGRSKAHPEFGVEGIAVEMANGKWIIPNKAGVCHSEIQAWIDEMLYYDPEAHTGDRLMASFFARQGASQAAIKVETGLNQWSAR